MVGVPVASVARRYPLYVWAMLALAWLGAFALILLSFLCCGLMLPLIPLFIAVVFGVSASLRSVHDFAESRAHPAPRVVVRPVESGPPQAAPSGVPVSL